MSYIMGTEKKTTKKQKQNKNKGSEGTIQRGTFGFKVLGWGIVSLFNLGRESTLSPNTSQFVIIPVCMGIQQGKKNLDSQRFQEKKNRVDMFWLSC